MKKDTVGRHGIQQSETAPRMWMKGSIRRVGLVSEGTQAILEYLLSILRNKPNPCIQSHFESPLILFFQKGNYSSPFCADHSPNLYVFTACVLIHKIICCFIYFWTILYSVTSFLYSTSVLSFTHIKISYLCLNIFSSSVLSEMHVCISHI